MSWDYLPKRDRMPAPSDTESLSPAMHELARKKRCHKLAMSILGKCLFAAALSIEPAHVPIGSIIESIDPLKVRRAKSKPKATKSNDLDLDLL